MNMRYHNKVNLMKTIIFQKSSLFMVGTTRRKSESFKMLLYIFMSSLQIINYYNLVWFKTVFYFLIDDGKN